MTARGAGGGEFAERVRSLASAFQGSRVLLTAIELDLFTVLEDEERTSVEVAAALEANFTQELMQMVQQAFDAGDRLLAKPDFQKLDHWIAGWPKARPAWTAG